MRPEVLGWGEDAAALGRAVRHPDTPGALVAAGIAAWKRGDLDGLARYALESRALSAELGVPDSCLVVNAMGSLGLVTGQLDDAVRWFDLALAAGPGAQSAVRSTITRALRTQAAVYGGAPWAAAWADELLAGLGEGPTGHGAYAWYVAAEAVLGDPFEARRRVQRALAEAEASGAWFVTGVAGATAASIDARSGSAEDAVAAYRWLLPWWRRAGEWSVLGTMLRSVAGLLARLERYRPAAVLLGAVTTAGGGHEVFGEDAVRLAELAALLEARLGPAALGAGRAEGGVLGVDAAAALAIAELEQLG
jgi:hypothetical protein